jgi:hypothetical protein
VQVTDTFRSPKRSALDFANFLAFLPILLSIQKVSVLVYTMPEKLALEILVLVWKDPLQYQPK